MCHNCIMLSTLPSFFFNKLFAHLKAEQELGTAALKAALSYWAIKFHLRKGRSLPLSYWSVITWAIMVQAIPVFSFFFYVTNLERCGVFFVLILHFMMDTNKYCYFRVLVFLYIQPFGIWSHYWIKWNKISYKSLPWVVILILVNTKEDLTCI